MTDQKASDEMILMDFLRDELSPQDRQQVADRLSRDESFRKLRGDIANTFAAISLAPEAQPPDDLIQNTMARVHQVQRTEALLAKEESRRISARATFSLRELTTVAAAVIVMAVVLIPSIRRARQLATISKCASNIGQIGAAILAYSNDNDDYLPAAAAANGHWLPTGGAAAISNSAALYKLIRGGYVSNRAFRCPAGGDGTFHVQAEMTDFPADRFISYSYQHSLGPEALRTSDRRVARVADKMVILADSTPLFTGGRFRPEKLRRLVSENHAGQGQNVLYLDMSVGWADSPDVGVGKDNIFLVRGITKYRGDERPADPTDTFLLPTFSPPSGRR